MHDTGVSGRQIDTCRKLWWKAKDGYGRVTIVLVDKICRSPTGVLHPKVT
jgi:hypothetical protein